MSKHNIKDGLIYDTWTNPCGYKINVGCFSCQRHSPHNDKKAYCNLQDKMVKRTGCCERWEAKKAYQMLSTGVNGEGIQTRKGRVKRPDYLQYTMELQSGVKATSVDTMRRNWEIVKRKSIYLDGKP